MEIKVGKKVYKKTDNPDIFEEYTLEKDEVLISRLEKKVKSLKQLINEPSVLQKDLDNAEALLAKLKKL